MFTGLFEGATSNRAELDYKTRHDTPRRESLSFIYDSYMQYHGPIPWVLLIPSIYGPFATNFGSVINCGLTTYNY